MEHNMILYHGSRQIVERPEIRIAKFHKDFYYGFYCTLLREQAKRWAVRYNDAGVINEYGYTPENIVERPMANDTIFNYVQNFVDGKISREAFWALAKFKKPTHQISFHTQSALSTLTFVKGCEVSIEE